MLVNLMNFLMKKNDLGELQKAVDYKWGVDSPWGQRVLLSIENNDLALHLFEQIRT